MKKEEKEEKLASTRNEGYPRMNKKSAEKEKITQGNGSIRSMTTSPTSTKRANQSKLITGDCSVKLNDLHI